MKANNSLLNIIFLIILLSFPVNAFAWKPDKTYHITILHTNDHHGNFWHNKHGEYGMAAQKTVIQKIRQEVANSGGNILLLSAGDINTGVPESDMQHAQPDFIGMNELGYDAMAIGNHEFDNPSNILLAQQKTANFPFLSANIYNKNGLQRVFKPYIIFNKDELKIAVIGLTTPDTPKISEPKNTKNYLFKNPIIETNLLIETIKTTEQPDIILVLSHLGYYQNAEHGSNAPGDVSLARSTKKGTIDMIIGGHSHTPVCMDSLNVLKKNYAPNMPCIPDYQNGTWIVQADAFGKYIGRADFIFHNGDLNLISYKLIPINTLHEKHANNKVPEDSSLLEVLTTYQKNGESKLGEIIGYSAILWDGDRNKVRYQQTPMGKLLLKAQRKKLLADFCVMGGGLIRGSIPKGNLTYRDLLLVYPFGNYIGYSELQGTELIDYITKIANIEIGSGGYAQWENISFKQQSDKSLSHIMINNQPFDMQKTYKVCTPNFHAEGGDGYPILKNYINTGLKDVQVLKEFIETNSPLSKGTVIPSFSVSSSCHVRDINQAIQCPLHSVLKLP